MGGGAAMTVNMQIALDVFTWSYGHLSMGAAVHTLCVVRRPSGRKSVTVMEVERVH